MLNTEKQLLAMLLDIWVRAYMTGWRVPTKRLCRDWPHLVKAADAKIKDEQLKLSVLELVTSEVPMDVIDDKALEVLLDSVVDGTYRLQRKF